jgi:hypothetical protein
MSWTTPDALKKQVQRLWNRGALLAPLAGGESPFPRRLTLKTPTSSELSDRYAEVRDWIAQLSGETDCCRIEWRTINHRILGSNTLPAAVWIDSLDDALRYIGKTRDAKTFSELVALTRTQQPALVPWLARRPLRALELADAWPRLLAVVEWVRQHPRPGIYPRQIALPGIDSKFIERHRGVLAELLDLLLDPEHIDATATGLSGFYRRYGFREKPLRVRFRLLDPHATLLPNAVDQDLTVTRETFAALDLPVATVFITENETNFLAFPEYPDALVVFGAGYGFENLAAAGWLQSRRIRYWGDIDTHGFAILHQLRGFFPQAESLLMDEQTLLAHRTLWGHEAKPEHASLTRLTDEEQQLYQNLRDNTWGHQIRLEQECISYAHLLQSL